MSKRPSVSIVDRSSGMLVMNVDTSVVQLEASNLMSMTLDRHLLDQMVRSSRIALEDMYRGSYGSNRPLSSQYKLVLSHQQPYVFRSNLMSAMAFQMSKTPSMLKGRISIGNTSYDGPPDGSFRHDLIHFCNSHIIDLKVDSKQDTSPNHHNYATRLVTCSLNPDLIMNAINEKDNAIRSFFNINNATIEIVEDVMAIGFDKNTSISSSNTCTCQRCRMTRQHNQDILPPEGIRDRPPARLYVMMDDV